VREYGLGRRPEFDPRSRAYPARELLADAPTRTRTWDLDVVLDQGSEGACVGFAWTHEILAQPVVPASLLLEDWNAYARGVYREAQTRDEWPGEDYEGTSVLAGAKVLAGRGWLAEYRWAFGTADVLDVLSQLGPVVLGVNWYDGMFTPDEDGLVHPEGRVAGGHALLCRGLDDDDDTVLLHNSWGPEWGFGGEAWLRVEDLDRLLHEAGEACVPVRRTLPEDPDVDPVPDKPGCLSLRRFLRRR